MPNINDFKAQMAAHGAAKPNLFRVMLSFPNYAIIGGETELGSFMCKATQLPQSTIGVIEVPYKDRKLPIAGTREFEDWTVTVYNNEDYMLRNAFERWSNGINAHSDGTGVSNPGDYMVDAYVEHQDQSGNVIKIYNFKNIWPTIVGQMEVGYENENQFQEFEVTFKMTHWESDTTS